MRRVAVTELKNQLSRYLRLVKQGETVEIVEHAVPIARITGMRGARGKAAAGLDRLIRDGIVSPARLAPDRSAIARAPVPCSGDVVAAIALEREGR